MSLKKFSRSQCVWVALLASWLSLAAMADDGWQTKVHPLVLEEIATGEVEFLVVLDRQADLAAAKSFRSKADRGAFVVRELQALARKTQAALVAEIEARGLDYRSFWVTNMIRVRGGLKDLEALARFPGVLRVSANPEFRLEKPVEVSAGAEKGEGTEWNLAQVNAPAVWKLGYDGQGVVVAGQDTGYDWQHPALQPAYRGWDGVTATHDYNWHDAIHSSAGSCPGDSPAPCDDHNHGTHTMGTMIGDDGGTNLIGVSPGARWIGCRNMDQGNGTPASYSECFEWFIAPTDANGENPDPSKAPHVINNSWVCTTGEGCDSDTLQTVVENTRAAGIVVVTAAGNGGNLCSTVSYPPAIYEASFSVGATDSVDQAAGFSSRGPVTVDGSSRMKPDVAAPGIGIKSAIRGEEYRNFSGTSMAAPHVAGVVALLLSARPDLAGDVDTIEGLLTAGASPLTTALEECGGVLGSEVPNNTYGHGRIDALAVLTGDADADATENLSDCLPLDGERWSAPGTVTDLTLVKNESTVLEWSTPADPGASVVSYRVLRSTLADDFANATCLPTTEPVVDDAVPTHLFFYLIEVQNDCGANAGVTSAADPRFVSCP